MKIPSQLINTISRISDRTASPAVRALIDEIRQRHGEAVQGILFYGGVSYIDNYLIAFADTLGLDINEFKDCLNDGKYQDRMLQDGNDAQRVGINSTPSFLINGTLVRGNIPYEQFKAYIDGAISAISD